MPIQQILLSAVFSLVLIHSSDSQSSLAQAAEEGDWAYRAPLAASSLLLDVAVAGQDVMAVGQRGHILVSRDGGVTWTQAEVPTRRMLCAVSVLDGQHAWVVGHDAIILHSTDSGQNWSRQHYAPEVEAPLFDVWFEDRLHGIAVGAYGLFLETFDGGQSWQPRSLSDAEPHHFAIARSPGGVLYIAGEFGTIFRSTDRGRSWQACPSPYRGSFFGLLALADESVLVFGLRGNLYRSTDGGQNWQQLTTGTTAALLGGAQRADGTVVIVGLSGCILISGADVEQFRLVTRPERTAMSTACELHSARLLILGEDGLRKGAELSLE